MTDVLFDFFFFKQKTAYELRISDWSSDVCSSDLLDGIGPRELGLEQLASRLATGEVQELIIATNPTVEGEATAHYLAQLARNHGVRPSRLAHGVPLGGELEYVDRGTLSHAFRSEEHTSEPQSLMRISYAVFCLTTTHQPD